MKIRRKAQGDVEKHKGIAKGQNRKYSNNKGVSVAGDTNPL